MTEFLAYVKYGVDLSGISPAMWSAVSKIAAVFAEQGYPCVITSGRDGKHMAGSKHYSGNALDFRALHIKSPEVRRVILTRIKEVLGRDYDVLLHGKALHYHVEFDPKQETV